MTEGALDTCHALWIGGRLGPVGVRCLESFVRAGHRVVLHSYEAVEDIPDGVEAADAGRILPSSRIFVHEPSGSYSAFANLFRYHLLQRGVGIWIDCDVVCLRPLESKPYVFGYQSSTVINQAVFKLPPESPVLKDMIELFDRRFLAPPWFSWRRKVRQYLRAVMLKPTGVAHAPWGTTGPSAATWYIQRHDLVSHAEPPDAFYPLRYQQAARLLDPAEDWSNFSTEGTRCIHLWNEIIRRKPIPDGSPLDLLVRGDWPS